MAKDTHGGVGVGDRNECRVPECHKALQSTTIIRDASAQVKGIVGEGVFCTPIQETLEGKKSQT